MNINQIQTTLLGLVVIILGIVGNYLRVVIVPFAEKVIPSILEKFAAETGQVRFNRMEKAATLIWGRVKNEINIGKFVGDEVSYFEGLLVARYPKITKADLDLLSKGVTTTVAPTVPVLQSDIQEVEKVVENTPIVADKTETPVAKELDKVSGVLTKVVTYYNELNQEMVVKPVAPVVAINTATNAPIL